MKQLRSKPSGRSIVMALMGGVCLLLWGMDAYAQEAYSLRGCLEYAVQHNRNIKKSGYDKGKAYYAHQEVLGALMPQINGSANLNDNLKKAKFVMPNFMNSMLPPGMQDPNASKYMTVEMGTKYSANMGLSVNQQLLNFPLFNALKIAEVAERMAALGVESTEEDVIAQTATLFYAIQSTEYAVAQMSKSVELVEKMLKMMEVNHANGLVKKVDVDRLKVNLTNLLTQKSAIENAIEVQKNLLKLQMGMEMDTALTITPMDLSIVEQMVSGVAILPFAPTQHTAYKLLAEKLEMADLQKKSATYEYLPTLSLVFNMQYNGVSDQFFRGQTNYWYPTSVIGLSLRIPIFSGLSRRAKVRESDFELKKAQEDMRILGQSLDMAHKNAILKLNDTQRTIALQKDNQALAEQVFEMAQNNYVLGVASMSDVLNASQSLIQAQMSYANALNECMKAYIDLKKASGEIKELMTTH
ncbi:MAG: TolC family protein [Bacteroidales bacterium]|uniref:TolC family protein n=1 Tax=Porphyromonas sp. TaxID=1924944 RepID=UPI0029710719|nr:TolC family protein [Porphyromonas sp.]MDD7438921.1 TolC family protein [Bacteroidales bacterium]MDY3067245.1 TolC family protein [Porphyromonas sp.]